MNPEQIEQQMENDNEAYIREQKRQSEEESEKQYRMQKEAQNKQRTRAEEDRILLDEEDEREHDKYDIHRINSNKLRI